jgi:hypothetical protein
VPVGSAALGLMVWPDLDLTVVCRRLDAEAVAGAGASLAGHPRVREVRFIDDTGDWNTDPTYPDGLYLGLRCRSLTGRSGRWTSGLSMTPTGNLTWPMRGSCPSG